MSHLKKTTLVICANLLIASQLLGFQVPQPKGYVTDTTQTLSRAAEQTMEQASRQLDQQTGIQVTTLIIQTLDRFPIENAAIETFEQWKPGQKNLDNGVLFITALDEKKTRIEVGYGLEGDLPDGKVGALLDQYVIPYFKQGMLEKGLYTGHLILVETLANTQGTSILNSDIKPHESTRSNDVAVFLVNNPLLIIPFIFLFIFSPTFRWFVIGMMLGGGRRSSGGFGGFGGGGFGGFGGGMSGGGGASRGW